MRRWIEQLEQFAIEVILENRGGKRAALLRGVLHALSHVYAAIVQLRLWLFRKRIIRETTAGVLVADAVEFLICAPGPKMVLVDGRPPAKNKHPPPRGRSPAPQKPPPRGVKFFTTKPPPGATRDLGGGFRQYNRTAEIIECA